MLFLGDSFTWGVGVHVRGHLAAACRAARLAHAGRALGGGEPRRARHEHRAAGEPLLESEGWGYAPDVVRARLRAERQRGRERGRGAPRARLGRGGPERQPAAPDLASTARRSIGWCARESGPPWRTAGASRASARCTPPTTPAGSRAPKALDAMGGMCRERGVPFVVAIFPLFGNPLDDAYPFAELHAQVAQVAAEAGAKVRRPPAVLPRPRWELLVVDGAADEHPNEIAHRIAAQAIAEGPRRRRAARAGSSTRASMSRGLQPALLAAAARAPRRPLGPRHAREVGDVRRGRAPARGLHLPGARRPPPEPRAASAREARWRRAAAPRATARAANRGRGSGPRRGSGSSAGVSCTAGTTPTGCCSRAGCPWWRWRRCLVVAVFVVARKRFSPLAACAAAGLAALSPDVLAHGRLVTTDLAFASSSFSRWWRSTGCSSGRRAAG